MVAWFVSGDGDVDEVDVDVDGVLCLPDDKLIRILGLVKDLSGLVNDEPSLHLSDCK